MSTIAEALATGIRHHQAEQFAEAERVYRQVLSREPRNAQALYLLGTLALQCGKTDLAVELIVAAIGEDSRQPAFHANLGEAYRRQEKFAEAIRSCQAAIALQPTLANAHANLGLIHQQQGNLPQAASAFEEVIRLRPDDAQARVQLGRVRYDQGQLSDAEACFRHVALITPNDPRAHFNLGSVLQTQGKFGLAHECYSKALALDPNAADVHNNLGILLKDQRKPAEAEIHFRRAVQVEPRFPATFNNLGETLASQGKMGEALAAYRQAIELDPNFAEPHHNMCGVLVALDRFDEAEKACRKAIKLRPDFAAAYWNLGNYLQWQGQLDDALAAHRQSMQLAPHDDRAHSNLLYLMNYHPALSPAAIFAEHRAWGQRHADPLTLSAAPHGNDRTADRRLRIGYVSAHFVSHAVNFFTEPILAAHDHSRYEVFCYADVAREDPITNRLKTHADHWRDIVGKSDAEVSRLVRDDQIDILVDLAGHIGGSRLLVFARKPAPVQVTYIGYQNTTGMLAMDYRLTDAWSDPPGATEALHTEQLIRLPRTFFCYLPSADVPDIAPLPRRANGHITFGSFNSFAKVTPQVLATWAEILTRVPNSRLVILAGETAFARDYLRRSFERNGVDSERIELVRRSPRREYLQWMNRTDIALDPFPFNGHTTTCDALWQGLPVVALAGETYVSRFGSSALANLGLDDCIAHSRDEYVNAAVRLAADVDRLDHLRTTMRAKMRQSPILDADGFTRNLEAAYRKMWLRWIEGHRE